MNPPLVFYDLLEGFQPSWWDYPSIIHNCQNCICEFGTHCLSLPFADVTLEDSKRQQERHAATQKAEVTDVVL